MEYERYGQGQERSPDLTVTFRTRTCFHLEVTRVRMAQGDAEGRAEKLIRIVCEKMGQSIPQMFNCLVIATEGEALTADEVNTAMKSLKQRVELREEDLLSRIGFVTSAEFYKQFQWLNGIVLCAPTEQGDSPPPILWINVQARNMLPPEILPLLQSMRVETV